MSEKRNWDQDFPKTPESFKLALKQKWLMKMIEVKTSKKWWK